MHQTIEQQLAAFVPTILLTDAPPVGEISLSIGAALFTDLSGFTRLTERLAQLGARGAEVLSQTLRKIFTPLIDAIHAHGGTISHFYGDAMLVYFFGEGAITVPQAFHCAATLQTIMQSFETLTIEGNAFQFSLKCGVGFGGLRSLVVSAGGQREFVLAGSSVEEATAAEKVGNHQIEVGERAATFLKKRRIVSRQPTPVPQQFPTWLAEFVPAAIVERLSTTEQMTLAEHRPITSMFVSFEGLSAEGDTFSQQLCHYFDWAVELVNRYAKGNGRVNRILTGDKGNQLHIILGAPTAPHAPAQALRLALALQREKPAFINSQKIGVACGRAFAVPLGSDRRHEYTIIGKVVNLSARLCAASAPNEIICDPYTAQLTEQSLQFERLEPLKLKGIQSPITPMRLVRSRANPAQLEARYGGLFGRRLHIHNEMFAALTDALQAQVRLITIIGEPGIGKSRIVAAAAEQWLRQGNGGFVAACAPESAESPYTPWIAIARALIDLPPTASPTKQMQQFQALYADLPSNDQTKQLIDDLPLLFEAMGLPAQLPDSLAKLNAKTKQARLFTFIHHSLRLLTGIQPHLFIFEDIHYADRASLDLINFLIDAADLQLTLLVTTSDERPNDKDALRLQRLAPSETIAFVCELLQLKTQPLPEPLISYFTRTGSHQISATPLFLEEVVRAMWANEVLSRIDGLLCVDEERLTQLSLPNNVHALILARIDKLPHIYRNALNFAAVIGPQFEGSILHNVAPFAKNSIDRSLVKLQSAEFIRPIGNDTYLFQHGMTREAAYETLPFGERKALHAKVAEALETKYAGREREISADLARHHAYADHHQKAVQFGKIAAQDAFELYANRDALRLCNLCLDHVRDEFVLWTEILLLKAYTQLLLGDFAGAAESAEEAIALDEGIPPALIYQGYARLSMIAFQQGQYEQSLQQAKRLLDYLQSKGWEDVEALIIGYSRTAKALSALHLYDEALQHLHEAEQLCGRLNDDRRFAFVLDSMAHCYFLQHNLPKAADTLQRAVSVARSNVRDNEFVALLNNLALIYCANGQYAASNDIIVESLSLAQTASPRLYASALSRHGTIQACLGNYHIAETAFLKATQLLISMNDANRLLDVYLLMIEMLYLALNQLHEAEQCLEKADKIIKEQSRLEGESIVRWYLAMGCIALHKQKYEEATRSFEAAMKLINTNANRQWLTRLHLYGAKAARQMGHTARALQEVTNGIAIAHLAPEFLGSLLLEKALLSGSQSDQNKQIQRAVEQLMKQSRYEHRADAYAAILPLIESRQSKLTIMQIAPLVKQSGAIRD